MVSIHRSSNTPPNVQQAQRKERPFTKGERKANALLRKVPRQSIYGYTIGNTLDGASRRDFRELIIEVHEQIKDCRVMMIEIIGIEAVEAIENLSQE